MESGVARPRRRDCGRRADRNRWTKHGRTPPPRWTCAPRMYGPAPRTAIETGISPDSSRRTGIVRDLGLASRRCQQLARNGTKLCIRRDTEAQDVRVGVRPRRTPTGPVTLAGAARLKTQSGHSADKSRRSSGSSRIHQPPGRPIPSSEVVGQPYQVVLRGGPIEGRHPRHGRHHDSSSDPAHSNGFALIEPRRAEGPLAPAFASLPRGGSGRTLSPSV